MEVTKIREFTGHSSGIYKLTAGFKSNTILSFSGDGRVVEWDLTKKDSGILRAKSDYKFFTGLPHSSTFSCFAGDMNGALYQLFFDKKEDHIKAWKTHNKGLFSLVSMDNLLFSGGGDGSISKWNIQPFHPLETLPISKQSIRCMLVDHKRGLLLAGASDGCIYTIDPASMRVIEIAENAHESSVFSMIMVEESLLISGGRDAYINFWKYPQMELNHRIPAHMFTVNDLSLSPCKKYFASAGRDKEIRIWSTKTYQLVKVIDRIKNGGHINSVNTVYWDQTTGWLCSGSDDRTLIVWEFNTN